MRALHDVQEAALPYQTIEIADRVTSEFFVVEIHPEPNSQTTVVDVEGSGFGVTGNDKEHQQRLWELHPFFNLRVLSQIQQSLHGPIRASADAVWCVPEIDHWDYVHPSKHMSSSSQVRSRCKRYWRTHDGTN